MPKIKIDAKYFNQVDNDPRYFGTGHRQCTLTANAIAVEEILKKHKLETLTDRAIRLGLMEPECAYGVILNKYGDTTDHNANTQAIRVLEIESYFSVSLSVKTLIKSLEVGIPIPVGLHYKESGHSVTIVGVDTDNEFFWAHDPYGVRAGIADYYEKVGGQSGKFDKYSFRIMKELWESMNDGWGRVFTHIKSTPTGLK
ncbi:C39 family peptidase [Microcoleus sp. Pol10D4]|uniref:C39 family peptidase n=1 Tax=Microcoleus sp. Pol10D4 TaxID=3055387 RepID=UPI002FD5288B